jgi:hypothetical protein
MRTAKECLQQAEHAEQLALKASDPRSKALLLDIAHRWRELIGKDADTLERSSRAG